MHGITWPTENRFASQVGLCSKDGVLKQVNKTSWGTAFVTSAQCYDVTVDPSAPLVDMGDRVAFHTTLHNSTALAPVRRPSCCSFRDSLFWYSLSAQVSQLVSTGSHNVELLRKLLGVKLQVISQIVFTLGKLLKFVALLTQQFCPEHF